MSDSPLIQSFNPNIQAIPRPASGDSKADISQKHKLDTIYRMSYNESPFGPSPKAVEAIQQAALNLGDYPPYADEGLRQTLAETLGQGLSPAHLFTGSSGFDTLELVSRAFIKPDDEMIISNPTFGIYSRLAHVQGASVVDVPLAPATFRIDIDGILAAINERTRIIIMCNPNNPTGTIMTAAEMDRLVDGLPDQVVLVMDEVYAHFVTRSDFPNSIGHVLAGKNTVVVHSFSKAYGLAGLRLGYGITTPVIADYVGRLHRGFHQNQLALAGGIAAVRDQAHLQRNVALTLAGKRWLYEQFDRLDLRYWPSETNFVVVETPRPASEIVERLIPFGVLVRPLSLPGVPHCLRVTISEPAGNEAFITGLETILASESSSN